MGRRLQRVAVTVVLGGLTAAMFVGATTAPAVAHAKLVATTPADGATVAELEHVELRFASDIDPASAHVWLESTAAVLPLGPVTQGDDRRAIEVVVPELIVDTYRVGFHVIAADGDAVSGDFGFTFDDALAPPRSFDTSGASAVAEVSRDLHPSPADPREMAAAITGALIVAALLALAASVLARKRRRPARTGPTRRSQLAR